MTTFFNLTGNIGAKTTSDMKHGHFSLLTGTDPFFSCVKYKCHLLACMFPTKDSMCSVISAKQ